MLGKNLESDYFYSNSRNSSGQTCALALRPMQSVHELNFIHCQDFYSDILQAISQPQIHLRGSNRVGHHP